MSARGPFSHIDLSVRDPAGSIPFYAPMFEALAWRRMRVDLPDFFGPDATRAAWFVRVPRVATSPTIDTPVDYIAHRAYSAGYYAAFFADPDRMKVEVVYESRSNP